MGRQKEWEPGAMLAILIGIWVDTLYLRSAQTGGMELVVNILREAVATCLPMKLEDEQQTCN